MKQTYNMAEKKVNGILKNNTEERNDVLRLNKGKYNGYKRQLTTIVGMAYNAYQNEKNPVLQQQHSDLLRYTHNGSENFSKELHEKYGIDKETLKYYSQNEIKPSYNVNEYDGYGDYISYMWDVYGMDESYAGHLAGLMNVRELAEDLAYDIVPSFEGKTAQDVINEILQYTNIEYAMEGDKVGIVRDINVSNAINGVITTNINNFSGKESKMGIISNKMYASSLLYGAQFNSMRRNKYITPELDTLYGNNLNNVYNLSSLFRVSSETGRIIDPDTDVYAASRMPNGNVFDYLPTVIFDFELPESNSKGDKYDWSVFPNYGEDDLMYDKQHIENIEASTASGYAESNRQQLYVYSEGDTINENDTINIDEYRFPESDTVAIISNTNLVDDIELNNSSLLSKTNNFLRKRKINTILSRFHDQDNKKNSLTQSSVSRFGVSHGRNLLTKNAFENGVADKTNNYSNPYCRVWTAHHQYSKMKHLIRPFIDESNFMPIADLQKEWFMFRGADGGERLSDHGVLNKNGMVNITPTVGDNSVDIKHCMFSIENLAWKDVCVRQRGSYRINESTAYDSDNEQILSEEQIGPNGGRIMWFPPYDLNFQETAQASWNKNEFIGRGEPVYTYTNSDRSGTLDFTILVDHPSIVNYWMLNKKNNSTENDEQTLLRFFAGCETIDDLSDVIEDMKNEGLYAGDTRDPSLLDKEDAKDIIFYTFFPNNFSGVDFNEDSSTESGLDYIFGGMLKEKNVQISGDTTNGENISPLMLGYEMGVNPMSINKIFYKGIDKVDTYFLDKLYDYSSAEKIYGDKLDEFTINNDIPYDGYRILPFYVDENEKAYFYIDYNDIVSEMNSSEISGKNISSSIEKLNKDIDALKLESGKLEEEIKELYKKRTEYKTGTTVYTQITETISIKQEEQKSINSDIGTKRNTIVSLLEEKDNSEEDKNYKKNLKEIIENALKISGEKQCTKPMYVCYNYVDDTTAETDLNFYANIFDNPYDAYIQWKKSNLTKINTKSQEVPPYSLLKDKQEFCCKSEYKENGKKLTKYWVKELVYNSDIFYYDIDSKRDFLKSGLKCGKMKKNETTTFFVNDNGSISEFTSKEQADIFIGKIKLLEMTKNEFIESDELLAINKENTNEYMYYTLKLVDTEQALESEMKKYMEKESGNDNKFVIQKYYENHKFGKLSDMGVGLNYGLFQFFYTAKLQERGETYETVQDIIARHNFKVENTETKPPQYKTTAKSKYFLTTESKQSGELLAEINWDLNNAVLSYPIDDKYKDQSLEKANHYDMESYGLNSTLEMVKSKVNPDATFSFGEVYAALHGDKEKEFVLSCERGILSSKLNYKDEELEEKVKEAEDRIEYLKKVFNPSSGQTDLQITKILTKGTASSHGNTDMNKELSTNRKKSIETFLQSFTIMANVQTDSETSSVIPEEENNIVPVAEGDEKDINAFSAKYGRCARTKIIVGKEDWTVNEMAYLEANKEQLKENFRRRMARRYDNEKLFFEMLRENDNIAYNRLVDKVKYFSPAFHSITPEGFNARLTFLHQCTRQGPTSTASDVMSGTTAANLAFGRPPFCVLRLGDFLNTKIIIESINITYPDSQWDLNPEGIGVQFMMAKVSMQIKIIGGSDISAPIKRLQNAVSFNYYANTSIYDNRSDTAKYNDVGDKILNTRQWFSSEKPSTPTASPTAPNS